MEEKRVKVKSRERRRTGGGGGGGKKLYLVQRYPLVIPSQAQKAAKYKITLIKVNTYT